MSQSLTNLTRALAAVVMLLISAAPTAAQTGASTGLSGRVTDGSGAAIPGARVTINHPDTGFERAVAATAAGDWEARFLTPGSYRALPTSARNITQLLAIEPGVSADISELLSNDNASISPSVNGARTTNNSFVFNGIDVTNLLCCSSRINGGRGTVDAGAGTLSRNIAPAPETLQEVKLQTSLYDAATGRNGGGIFQVVSKSGTNALRGNLYFYNQNGRPQEQERPQEQKENMKK